MKTLVTGATGFIGSHLVEALLKQGHSVACLVRKTSSLRWIEGLDVRLIYGDCSDKASLVSAVSEVDYIFHLAGLTKTKKEKEFFTVNAKGTENLLQSVAEHNPGIQRFVFVSSLAAAGPSRNDSPVNEYSEPKPVSAYGKSKLKAEQIVLAYKDRIPLTIIRPPAVYGPRDRDMFTMFKLLKKGIFPCWGKCFYSLVYVDDLVKAILLSAESKTSAGETFYISDGKTYSNYEIGDSIASALSTKPIRLKIPGFLLPLLAGIGQMLSKQSNIINRDKVRELRYANWTCDSSKAVKELDFIPKVALQEGVRWTADWYRIHQWL